MAIDNLKAADITISNINEDNIPQQTAVQGERSGRSLLLQITNGGIIENQPGVSVNLGWSHDTAKNSDGEKLQGLDSFQVIDRTKGIFRFDYPSNMMVPGRITAVIQMVGPSSDTRSKPFKIKIEGSPFDDDAAESDNSFTALQEALSKAENFSGGPIDTVSSESELKAKYPNGANGPVVVLEADGETGYLYTWDVTKWKKGNLYQDKGIADKSVTEQKLSFQPAVVNPDNLFIKSKASTGRYVNHIDGSLPSKIGYNISEYIEIIPNARYKIEGTNEQLAFYSDKATSAFVSGLSQAKQLEEALSPKTAKYIRISVKDSEIDNVTLKQRWALDNTNITKTNIDYITDNLELKDESINETKLAFQPAVVNPENLFDRSKITIGHYVNYQSGSLPSKTNYNSSDYIQVQPNTRYKIEGTNEQLAFYLISLFQVILVVYQVRPF